LDPVTIQYCPKNRDQCADLEGVISECFDRCEIYLVHYSFAKQVWQLAASLNCGCGTELANLIAVLKCLPLINISKVSQVFKAIKSEYQEKEDAVCHKFLEAFEKEFLASPNEIQKWNSNSLFQHHLPIFQSANRCVEQLSYLYCQMGTMQWFLTPTNLLGALQNMKNFEHVKHKEYIAALEFVKNNGTNGGKTIETYNSTENKSY